MKERVDSLTFYTLIIYSLFTLISFFIKKDRGFFPDMINGVTFAQCRWNTIIYETQCEPTFFSLLIIALLVSIRWIVYGKTFNK